MNDDLISRKAAIDALDHMDYMPGEWAVKGLTMCKEIIKGLPSAQPETHEERTETHACDLISRQAAIELVKDVCDAIMSGCESWYDPETEDEVYKDIREVDAILKCNKEVRIALQNMPSAQPERQKGEWIDYTEDGYVECPFCHSATNCDGNKDELHFCFSCGADMREDAEEPKKCDTCKHEHEPWSCGCADCFDYELWESKE